MLQRDSGFQTIGYGLCSNYLLTQAASAQEKKIAGYCMLVQAATNSHWFEATLCGTQLQQR
jgi:hypothetical protein